MKIKSFFASLRKASFDVDTQKNVRLLCPRISDTTMFMPFKFKKFIVISCLLVNWTDIMAIEEPNYLSMLTEEGFEIRKYEGYFIAETYLEGNFDFASRSGFRKVAAYIFGKNKNTDGMSEKIEMTAPVTVKPKQDGWFLHFVLPADRTRENLPIPDDRDVIIKQVKPHLAGSVTFSGFTTEKKIEEYTDKLRDWLTRKDFKIIGPKQIARYNDPFTLPWRRRNEIIFEIEKQD